MRPSDRLMTESPTKYPSLRGRDEAWLSVVAVAIVIVGAMLLNILTCRGTSDDHRSSASRAAQLSSGIVGHGAINSERPDTPHDKNRGALRLEGQVIDEAERPVADATVEMYSPPGINTKTEADGSFVFGEDPDRG